MGGHTCGPDTSLPCPHACVCLGQGRPSGPRAPAKTSLPALAGARGATHAGLQNTAQRREPGSLRRSELHGQPPGPQGDLRVWWGHRLEEAPSGRHRPGAPAARGALSPRGRPRPARLRAPGLQPRGCFGMCWGAGRRPDTGGREEGVSAPWGPAQAQKTGCPGESEQGPALSPHGAGPGTQLPLFTPSDSSKCFQASLRSSRRKLRLQTLETEPEDQEAQAEIIADEGAAKRAPRRPLHPGLPGPSVLASHQLEPPNPIRTPRQATRTCSHPTLRREKDNCPFAASS